MHREILNYKQIRLICDMRIKYNINKKKWFGSNIIVENYRRETTIKSRRRAI